MPSYAIFGGNGFIGTNLCLRLSQLGHQVKVYGHSTLRHELHGLVEHSHFDMSQNRMPALDRIDTVVHLISTLLPTASNENIRRDIEDNLRGTISILDAAVKHGVSQFIFLSSGGTVYGAQSTLPIAEDASSQPLCSYAIVKRTIESYLALYKRMHGLRAWTLRVANPFGPFQRPGSQGLVASVMWNAMNDRPITIWGDGQIIRDYIFIDDVVEAIVAASEAKSPGGGIINIGSGIGRTVNDVIVSIEQVLGRALYREYAPGRNADVPANVLSIALAAKELAWAPRAEWASGLERTCRWLEVERSGASEATTHGGTTH